jgi:hypothetical protein
MEKYIMAHEIEMINGVAQMAYAGETPWHGLGVKVSNDLTPDQMMKKAGLDWEVTKEDIYFGDKVKVPGKKALIRTSDSKLSLNMFLLVIWKCTQPVL